MGFVAMEGHLRSLKGCVMSFAEAVLDINNYGPVIEERTITDLRIHGELPKGLNGTLYRNGPNPQFEVPGSHWFTGDGMLHAFSLDNGKATYRNRWVRTPKWLAEHNAGRAIFAGFRGKLPGAPESATDGGNANTNIIWHAGKLLALEEAHLPTEIQPHTLETIGYQDYGKAISGPFTAHPKIDPKTGELLFFGYSAGGRLSPIMSYGTISAAGTVNRFEQFEAPYASMVHDFMVTDRYVLFPILPLTGSLERARAGGPGWAWEPGKGTCVGLMPRAGSTRDIKWFRGEACYVFHSMNAWEEDERLIALVMQMEEAPFPNADGSSKEHDKANARLCRWEFDLLGKTDTFRRIFLDDLVGEFPRIDDRFAGLRSRVGWTACENPSLQSIGAFNGIVSYRGGVRDSAYFLPESDGTSEPIFVPRSKDAAEGEGWLLTVIWRANEGRSDLAIFEASDVDKGPIAIVELPCRVPYGFHGNWVGGE